MEKANKKVSKFHSHPKRKWTRKGKWVEPSQSQREWEKGNGRMLRTITFPVEREMEMDSKRKTMPTTTTSPFEMDIDRKKERSFESPPPHSKRKGRGKAHKEKGNVLRAITPTFEGERNR